MDLTQRLSISYYKTIASINESHKVYMCQHIETGKFYVKKVLEVYSPEVYRHLKDAPVEGVPQVLELCEEDGVLTVIEEYVPGRTLQEVIESGGLTLPRILNYMIQLCGTLEKLHSHEPPLIHRDLKPSNIMISNLGNAVILDLNAAKFTSGEDSRSSDTMLLGTKGYAAPEQYGFMESSPRTDLYALGVILREACDSITDYDHSLDPVIERCTQIDPEKRYRDAAELRSDLERHAHKVAGHNPATPVSGPAAFLPPGFRTRVPWKMLVATLTYSFLFWVSFLYEGKDGSDPKPLAERVLMFLTYTGIIFISANYGNIRRFFPLYNDPRPGFRIAGAVAGTVVACSILATITAFLSTLID